MFALGAVRLVARDTDDAFRGTEIAAEFACGCVMLWWADWARGQRWLCRHHDREDL